MSDKKKADRKPNVVSNYFYNLSYRLLAILVPFITTPYISRTLKVEAIGVFSYVQSIATYFSFFGIMGLDMYGQLQMSRCRDDKKELSQKFKEIFISKAITSIIALAIYSIVIVEYQNYRTLLAIMSILLIANIFNISWLYHGLEAFKKIVIRNYIIKIVGLILIFAFVKQESDVYLYAFILQGSTFLGNLSLWATIRQYVFLSTPINWKNVKKHIRNSLVYFLPAIATTIYTSTDKVMLGMITKSNYENGLYDQAHKIEQTIITIISSMGTVLLPRLAYFHSRGSEEELNRYINHAIRITGFMEAPIAFGIFSVADIFIPVFLGDQFSGAVILTRIFSVLVIFSGINAILGNSCLVAQGKQNYYNFGVMAGAGINIVLNAVLIPFFTARGAAVASLASEAAVFCVFLHFSKNQYISLPIILGFWWKYFISAAIMGIVVFTVGKRIIMAREAVLVLQVFIGIVIYILMLILLRDCIVMNFFKRVKKQFFKRGHFS